MSWNKFLLNDVLKHPRRIFRTQQELQPPRHRQWHLIFFILASSTWRSISQEDLKLDGMGVVAAYIQASQNQPVRHQISMKVESIFQRIFSTFILKNSLLIKFKKYWAETLHFASLNNEVSQKQANVESHPTRRLNFSSLWRPSNSWKN